MSQDASARDFVITAIREAIIGGELKPGEHLVEQSLAERFGVSRSPVREALVVLQKLGLVEHRRHRGMFVSRLDVAQYREVYLLRGVLEGLACSLAAHQASAEEIAELQRLNGEMATLVHDVDAFMAANIVFHRRILDASRSPLLAQMIEELWIKCQNVRHANLFAESAPAESIRDHALIIYAIAKRDGDLARLLGTRAVYQRWPGLQVDGQGIAGWTPEMPASPAAPVSDSEAIALEAMELLRRSMVTHFPGPTDRQGPPPPADDPADRG